MRVILTPKARADLVGIGRYIARDNPRRARSFVQEMVAAAKGIGRSPHGFQVVDRYERSGIRRRPHGAYVIFYRVRSEQVEIIHILHGAQDYGPILFPDA